MDSESFATLTMQGLVDRIQAGDSKAQDEICRRVGERLERLASKMLKSYPGVKRWEQTDDVLQNSLMRLLKALKAVKPDNMRAFFGLATEQLRRQLLDLNRHYQGVCGHGRNLVDLPAAGTDETAVPALDPADDAASMDQTAELDRWHALHEAVEKLPVEEREVFGLVFYQGWTQAQIAELLNVNERTIRRYWQSVCMRLSEMLQGELPI
ncbi:MAG: sigma-70 family RNA polymerase sigma factor [Planctomycetaceae bacterium]